MDATITIGQLWTAILASCTGIITVSGAIAVICKLVRKTREPETKQNQRITALEKDIKEIHARLEKGDIHFDMDCKRMDALERTMKETNKVIIESLQALTAHAIDNSKVDGLKRADETLNNYLMSKI